MKFDSTISLKEMLEIAKQEGAVEFRRILPRKGVVEVELGKCTAKVMQ